MTAQLLLPAPVMLSVNIPFSGFYGSMWEDAYDSEVENRLAYWEEDRAAANRDIPALADVPADVIQWGWPGIAEALSDVSDFSVYTRSVAQEYGDTFAWWLAERLGLPEIPFEYEEMVSPKYYNFSTDRLFGKFSVATLTLMRDTVGAIALEQAFCARFTSYDGFSSFYDPRTPTKPLEDWDHNELGKILTAYIELALVEDCYDCLDDALWENTHEYCGNAHSDCVDYPALNEKVLLLIQEWDIEHPKGFERIAPRCPDTLELPL